MSTNLSAIVYSADNCKYCTRAINLLMLRGYGVEVRKVTPGDKLVLLQDFPDARSVPQCIVNGIRVGSYDALVKYLG